jgi:hypothetical protein
MKNLKKLNILLALIFVSVALMSFIPSTNSNSVINNNGEKLFTPDPSASESLHVGWKEVNVNYRTSGNYYVLYSDIVSNINPDHTMTWGCGNLDLIPSSPDWDCNETKTWFSAGGSEGCAYIHIHSNCILNPNNPTAIHTLDIKVKDNQGDVSNVGGITFIIHYTATPNAGEPTSPCSSY